MGVLGKGRKIGITKMKEREVGVPEGPKKNQPENEKNLMEKIIKRTPKMKKKLLSLNLNVSPTRPQ